MLALEAGWSMTVRQRVVLLLLNVLINGTTNSFEQQQLHTHLTQTKLVKKARDGFVLAQDDTPRHVTIHDTRNNATLIILKKENPGRLTISLPLNYAHNVRQWFSNPLDAKHDQGYLIPGSKKYRLTTRDGYDPVLLHAFSSLVDEYIPQLATQGTKPSRKYYKQDDTAFYMPGYIIDKHKRKFVGTFTYFLDARTGMCYHRFFKTDQHKPYLKKIKSKTWYNQLNYWSKPRMIFN